MYFAFTCIQSVQMLPLLLRPTYDLRPSVFRSSHFRSEKFAHASVRSDAPIFAYASKHSGFRRVAGLTLLTGAPLMI